MRNGILIVVAVVLAIILTSMAIVRRNHCHPKDWVVARYHAVLDALRDGPQVVVLDTHAAELSWYDKQITEKKKELGEVTAKLTKDQQQAKPTLQAAPAQVAEAKTPVTTSVAPKNTVASPCTCPGPKIIPLRVYHHPKKRGPNIVDLVVYHAKKE